MAGHLVRVLTIDPRMKPMTLLRPVLTVLLSSLLSSATLAQVLHVDPERGDDANPGSAAAPVATLARAAEVANAGTGGATTIDLGGATVPNGDGLMLDGRTLFVVQNFLNQISVIRLSSQYNAGEVVETLTDPALRIPTGITGFGSALCAVNARFDVPPGPATEYEIVRVPRSQ